MYFKDSVTLCKHEFIKYDSSNDSKYRKSKINKRDKKKKTPETHETGLVILIVDRL